MGWDKFSPLRAVFPLFSVSPTVMPRFREKAYG